MTSQEKDKNYWSVLDSVIRLEVSKGHLLWKITELSRISGVGRPLIYYYFGKSKEEIVQTAMKIIGDEFYGLSDERIELWKAGRVAESILLTRELMQNAPYVSVFFFHWRHRAGEISQYFKELEARYKAKLAALRPEKSPIEIEAIFAIFFGLILFPDVQEKTIRAIVDRLEI